MNWLTITIVLGIIMVIVAAFMESEGFVVIGVGIAGMVALIGVIAMFDVYWGFPAYMARLTTVRSAVERLGCSASEDVIGKAADYNADVASARMWNGWWIGDPFYNDGIDTVTMIVIPQCRQGEVR